MPTGQDEVRAGRPSTQQPLDGILADTKTAAVIRAARVAQRSPLLPGIEAGRPASPTRKDRVARRTIPAAEDSVLRRTERIASPQVSGAHPRRIRAWPSRARDRTHALTTPIPRSSTYPLSSPVGRWTVASSLWCLGAARSAVSSDLGHNRECNQRYSAVRTLAPAAGRRQVASERPLKLGAAGWEHIEASRNRGYSPELIAGRQESCGSDAQ